MAIVRLNPTIRYDRCTDIGERGTSFYAMRRTYRGWVEIDAQAFIPFVGNVLIVRTWNGHRFAVDRFGGAVRVTAQGPDSGQTVYLLGEYYENTERAGFVGGIDAVVELTSTGGKFDRHASPLPAICALGLNAHPAEGVFGRYDTPACRDCTREVGHFLKAS